MSADKTDSVDRPAMSDAGSSEIMFGLMFLAFAVAGWLDAGGESGTVGILLTLGVLVLAWYIGLWIHRSILKQVIWPRTGYMIPRRGNYVAAGQGSSRRKHSLWILLVAIALAGIVFGILAGSPGQGDAINLLGIIMFTGLLVSYAFWLTFNGWKEAPWKWAFLLVLAAGYFMIGLPVRGDYFEVWPQVTLFTGLVWIVSGGITMVAFLRRPKLPVPNAE